MSFSPNDLVTDTDLVAYERGILTQMGATDWQARRQKAMEDWLFPLLESKGFAPQRFRTRHVPTAVVAGSTDKTSAASTDDGLDLPTIFATGTSYLYVGFAEPFRGLSIRMLDHVNAVAGTLGLTVWTDSWAAPSGIVNGTVAGSASFAKGGAITWTLPEGLTRRTVAGFGPYYWARLALSAVPTSGTLAGALSVIQRSRLCAAVTFRTIALIFREAPAGQDGPWQDKASWYEAEAERAFGRVADSIGGEFDADDSDEIDEAEADTTAEEASGGGWAFERG